MMNRKHLLLVVLVVILLFSFGPAVPSEGAAVKTLKLGHIFAQDSSANLAVEMFINLVKERTNGAYSIDLFPNSQLGNERELCEAVSMGTLDITLCGDSFVNWYTPEYGALCGFFTWRDFDHAEKAFRSALGDEVSNVYSERFKTTVLDYWIRAPRYLCVQKPMHQLSDFKGYTLRIPDDVYYFECFKALGANPTPLAFDEIYMGLKQGTVNGLENPLEDLYNNSFYDVTQYIIETAHQISMFGMLINDKVLADMPADVRDIFKKSAVEAGDYQNKLMKEAESGYRAKLEEKGMQFMLPDDFEVWRNIINTDVSEKFADTWKPGILERALAF